MPTTKEVRMAGELSFFELGVQDAERGRAFYEGLFGWRFAPGPSGEDEGSAPYVFFAVDDIEAAMERVRELGGVVDEADIEGDEDSIARSGRFKLCRDDQGSPFGLHQPPAA
jgi:uncharacterized protein